MNTLRSFATRTGAVVLCTVALCTAPLLAQGRGMMTPDQRVDNLERAQLRTLADQLRDKLGSGVVVLGSASNGNVAIIVGVTKDLTSRVQAGKVIGSVAQKIGGKGGGRPEAVAWFYIPLPQPEALA